MRKNLKIDPGLILKTDPPYVAEERFKPFRLYTVP